MKYLLKTKQIAPILVGILFALLLEVETIIHQSLLGYSEPFLYIIAMGGLAMMGSIFLQTALIFPMMTWTLDRWTEFILDYRPYWDFISIKRTLVGLNLMIGLIGWWIFPMKESFVVRVVGLFIWLEGIYVVELILGGFTLISTIVYHGITSWLSKKG